MRFMSFQPTSALITHFTQPNIQSSCLWSWSAWPVTNWMRPLSHFSRRTYWMPSIIDVVGNQGFLRPPIITRTTVWTWISPSWSPCGIGTSASSSSDMTPLQRLIQYLWNDDCVCYLRSDLDNNCCMDMPLNSSNVNDHKCNNVTASWHKHISNILLRRYMGYFQRTHLKLMIHEDMTAQRCDSRSCKTYVSEDHPKPRRR